MPKSTKFCKQCGKPVDPAKGRADRQYCDERCKNKFHNEKSLAENAELQRIDLVLKKNRRVLKKMFGRKDRDAIKRDKLLKEGFDFDFHTHHITTKTKKNEFIFCFDYGYCAVTKEAFRVIKAFEYREE